MTSTAQHSTARVLWIDVSRVIAALLIICVHGPNDTLGEFSGHSFFCARVAFFFLLAGYFVARNITWHKALNRAFRLFVPFVIWNTIVLLWGIPHDAARQYTFWEIFGIHDILIPGFKPFGLWGSSNVPPILPSWFLRDIILMTLVTPLLVRLKAWLVPLVLILFYLSHRGPLYPITLSLGSWSFYVLGVIASTRPISDLHRILNRRFTPIFWCCVFVPIIAVILQLTGYLPERRETPLDMMLGILLIMYAGMLIVRYLPNLAAKMVWCAPACFLMFMLHDPLFALLPACLVEHAVWQWVLPLGVFGVILLFYAVLKRFVPFLLPWLAHVNYPKNKISE